jgi:hypothetical protein
VQGEELLVRRAAGARELLRNHMRLEGIQVLAKKGLHDIHSGWRERI